MKRPDMRSSNRRPVAEPARLRRRRRIGACLPALLVRARRVRRKAPKAPGVPEAAFVAALGWLLIEAGVALALAVARRSTGPVLAIPAAAALPPDGNPRTPQPVPCSPMSWSTPRDRPLDDYLPPLALGNAGLARAIDFLIRNRGGRGPVGNRMWKTVDAASLPLGVYLRDVDDQSNWTALRTELRHAQVPVGRPVLAYDRRLHDEKVVKTLQLAELWADRGTRLLMELDEPSAAPTPSPRPADEIEPMRPAFG